MTTRITTPESWYLTYLVFADYTNETPSGEVKVQKQLHLITASDPEQALIKAADLGRLIDSVDSYFDYVGITDLVSVGPELQHGLVLDIWSGTHDPQNPPDESEYTAFHPAGPGVPQERRAAYSKNLWDRYPWYLADEILSPRNSEVTPSAVPYRVRMHMVLIHAPDGPATALRKALEDGHRRAQHESKEFLGLWELSLIDDRLEDGCEISWSESYADKDQLKTFVTPPERMKAFAPKP